ncbi:MAG: sigma-70 family RNA polymerase sigma factor [Elusimicrobiales bacterium]
MTADTTDSVVQYFKSMHDVITDVSREDMHELWLRAKRGDRRAKKRLMELNMRLVIPTAKRYNRPGTDLMDLVEEGNLGLIHAIDKFDPDRGYRFSTYATYWIEQYVRRAVEEQTGTIRIPPHAWESLRQWLKRWDKMQHKLGREPTMAEMAKEMGWTARQVKAVMEAAEAARGVGSLGAAIDSSEEGDITVEDTIVDDEANTPDNLLSSLKMRDELNAAILQIGDRERSILEMRYGLTGKKPMTLDEIGRKLRLSRERVRQIEERAILRLRRVTQRMGIVESGDLRRPAPNLHQGSLVIKGPTNVLGQPVGNHPLKNLIIKVPGLKMGTK